jgi:hypothetical protein
MAVDTAVASTITIGDIDGFGFTPIGMVRATPAPHTTPADTNGDNVLTAGEYLPDLNKDGAVAVGSGDLFDNRSLAELTASNGAQHTDHSKTPVGASNGLSFTFTFMAPTLGDPDYGFDASLDFVFGDYDNFPVNLSVDGVVVPFTLQGAGSDGLIQLATTSVPFADLLDGQVIATLIAPDESYFAIDYVQLVRPDAATPVPEPTSISLMLLGGAGMLLRRRRRARRAQGDDT